MKQNNLLNHNSIKVLFFFVFFGLVYSIQCQNEDRFISLSVKDGLSNGRVTAIVQDKFGFIWVGTKNGLNRYDSHSFKEYNQKNSGLSSDDISALILDKKGRIWIGTVGGGVNVYDSESEIINIHKYVGQGTNSLSSDIVHTIFEDSNGTIYAGTENGLNFYNEKEGKFHSYSNVYNGSNISGGGGVWAIEEVNGTEIWIGTYGVGLSRLDKVSGTFVNIHPENQQKEGLLDFINTIVQINQRELLVGTNGNGLLLYDIVTNEIKEFLGDKNHAKASIIQTITLDSKGDIWIGTDGQGLIKIVKQNSGDYTAMFYRSDTRLPSTISNNTINTIYQDNLDNIWVGTAWNGINVTNAQSNNIDVIYSDGSGYDPYPVLSVYKEGHELWMGTDGKGLSVFNLKSKHVTNYNSSKLDAFLSGDYVQCIKKTGDKYWLGTFGNGLILFDKNKGVEKQYMRNTQNKSSLPYNDVRAVIEMPSGDIWVGTWGGGLSYLDKNTDEFKTFNFDSNAPNSISSNNITSMLLSKDGKIWIGTFGGGLNLFDLENQQFSRFSEKSVDSNFDGQKYIHTILEDYQGNIWIGTRSGLYKFDVGSKTFIEFEVGISSNSNSIVSLLEDSNHNIWIGSRKGIFKYSNTTKIIEEIENTKFEFHINSAYLDGDQLYFGGVNGVLTFNINTANNYEKVESPLLLTNFKLFDSDIVASKDGILKKIMPLENMITLNHDDNVFTFQFSSFDYPISQTQYLIKMEGFENEWRNIGTTNFATYTNLSSGNYIFKVKSKKNDKINAQIHLKIKPPLYKTWWAYLGYFLFFIISLLLFRYYTYKWAEIKNNLKLEKLKREQEDQLHQLKQRFFTNVSHEIRTPLTLIIGTINSLMKANTNSKEQKQLSTLKSSTGRLMNLVSELLNIRKLETGNINLQVSENNLVDFLQEIFLAFSQHAIANNINYKFEKHQPEILVWFDKIQMEKTIYNLLTNAFKFTKGGDDITIKVSKNNNHAKIVVEDSGQGISEEKLPHIFERFYQNEDAISEDVGFGIGLSIVKNVIELHSGDLIVESVKGEGSRFIISLQLGKNHFSGKQIVSVGNEEELISNYSRQSVGVEKTNLDDKNKTVLIVEDNQHLLDYLESLLSEDYIVVTAKNGQEGLDKAIEVFPDMIISDIMMPVMDGVTLCYNLKTNLTTSHIPVILLTARTMVENIMEGFEMGADDYLVKPFNESVLKARINNLLKSRQKLREKYINEALLSPKEVAFATPDQEFLTKLNTIIETHIDISDFSVEQLASKMAMSHSNLYKKIKALTGMTTVAFIRDFRLKRASQFLEQGNLSIIDVCFKVGYTDRRHFSQEFKKKFGITPSAYAKEKQDI